VADWIGLIYFARPPTVIAELDPAIHH